MKTGVWTRDDIRRRHLFHDGGKDGVNFSGFEHYWGIVEGRATGFSFVSAGDGMLILSYTWLMDPRDECPKRFPTVATQEQLDRRFVYLGTTDEGLNIYGEGNIRHEYRERPDGTLELSQSYAETAGDPA